MSKPIPRLDGELYAIIKKETCPDPCKEKECVVSINAYVCCNIPAGWCKCTSYGCWKQIRAEYDRAGMFKDRHIVVVHPRVVLPSTSSLVEDFSYPSRKRKRDMLYVMED